MCYRSLWSCLIKGVAIYNREPNSNLWIPSLSALCRWEIQNSNFQISGIMWKIVSYLHNTNPPGVGRRGRRQQWARVILSLPMSCLASPRHRGLADWFRNWQSLTRRRWAVKGGCCFRTSPDRRDQHHLEHWPRSSMSTTHSAKKVKGKKEFSTIQVPKMSIGQEKGTWWVFRAPCASNPESTTPCPGSGPKPDTVVPAHWLSPGRPNAILEPQNNSTAQKADL